jgi:hypothetical protein
MRPHPTLLALLAALAVPASSLADEPPAPPPKPDLSAPAPPPPSLDFDLLGPDAAPVPAADPGFQRRVERRRLMLKVHQGMGIATWTALAATSIVGQLQFDDRFRGGGDTGKWRTPHKALVITSSTLFATSGLLALLAPEPYQKRPLRLDTATVHKVSMAVATAGMLAQIALGVAARGKAGSLQERDLATAHQVVGYTTLGAMTIGAGALFF